MSPQPDGRRTVRLAPPSWTPPPVLDPAQAAAAAPREGHVRVIGGPGSGKTEVIAQGVVNRLRAGVGPNRLLVLAPGRTAAERLRWRMVRALAGEPPPVVTTFHALAFRIVSGLPHPPRLMGGPEQEAALREIVADSANLPPGLRPAAGTEGFARQIADFIGRAQAAGLEPAELDRDRPYWEVVARLYDEYRGVLAVADTIDYGQMIPCAADALRTDPPPVLAGLSSVLVDEFEECDAPQTALLQALAARGASVVVAGNPDESVFGWRGSDPTRLLEFPQHFGEATRTVLLPVQHRAGPAIARVSARMAPRSALAGVAGARLAELRAPVAAGAGRDQVAIRVYDSEMAQADHIADLLRRAHSGTSQVFTGGPLAWSDMAVVVRSGRHDLPAFQRTLTAAGIPFQSAADELPLAREPAVAPLLDVLRIVAGSDGGATPERVRALVESPLCGLDPLQVREVVRRYRSHAPDDGGLGTDDVLRMALSDASCLDAVSGTGAERLRGLSRLVGECRSRAAAGGAPGEVLAVAWRGTDWPRRLRSAVLEGSPGASAADQALDAVCALFAEARWQERGYEGVRGLSGFLSHLDEQEVPAAPSAQLPWSRDAVRLVTAHRAKGEQWALVVVAGVQEGSWPDPDVRSGLLRAELLTLDLDPGGSEYVALRRQRLLEEQRLFHVACSRAAQCLAITAVRAPAEDAPEPSRYLEQAAGDEVPVVRVAGRPRRPQTPAGVVAALRSILLDPTASVSLRAAAGHRLERLAAERDAAGRPLFPAAAADQWWGVREWSTGDRPWYPSDEPLPLSASTIAEYLRCPRRWFLERQAAVDPAGGPAAAFGTLIHACAQAIGEQQVAPEEVSAIVDELWAELPFHGPWQSRLERAEAEAATDRLVQWLDARPGTPLAVEKGFRQPVTLADSGEEVLVSGSADWVDREGAAVVITDFKTGRNTPTAADLREDVQLGLYRWMSELGALDTPPAEAAQLLFLRLEPRTRGTDVGARAYRQEAGDVGEWLQPLVEQVVAGLRAEIADARPGAHCRSCPVAADCPALQDEGEDSP